MVNIFTRVRSATAYEVLQKNPLLADGEPFYEKDTGAMKIGDGVTRYNKLKYAGVRGADAGVEGDLDGGSP